MKIRSYSSTHHLLIGRAREGARSWRERWERGRGLKEEGAR